MKKFSVVAVLTLGIISVSGAFAGNNTPVSHVMSSDTVKTDSVTPQQPDSTPAFRFGISQNDTVSPDTVKTDSLR